MFEKFTSENIEAFRQRYEGTYGFYKDDKGKRMLVQLLEISQSRCTFVDAGGISYQLNPDSPRNIGFEFLPPKSAWYNTKNGAVFCNRLAKRQFSRGIMSGNLSIRLLDTADKLQTLPVGFPILSEIYEHAVSPAAAYRLQKDSNKTKSLAISKSFAISAGGLVYLYDTLIGTYKQSNWVSPLIFKLLEPELWRTEIADAIAVIGADALFT